MKRQGNILIVDDDKNILHSLEQLLKYEVNQVHSLDNPYNIPSFLKKHQVDVVLLDMNYKSGDQSGVEGLFWLEKIKKHSNLIHVIMITAYGDIDIAVKAVKDGAFNFITKPWENEKLLTTIQNALSNCEMKKKIEDLELKQSLIKNDINREFELIWGRSPEMEKIRKVIHKVSETKANVLITGENGTGKEMIAREIHRLSIRSNEILMKVDVGSLTDTLFESELFGYQKGAFTDAKEDRIGKVEAAHKGTLFIDEIGNLNGSNQMKLLSVLQNKTVIRVGGSQEIPVDFRLICATNKNLSKMVNEDLFREDLLYRINTIQVELPALRNRKEDIMIMADYYLKLYKEKYNKHSIQFSNKSISLIKNHKWPGNIRELKHTIEKSVILSDGDIIKPHDLFLNKYNYDSDDNSGSHDSNKLADVERRTILKVLSKHNGNLTKVAKELDVSRTTLYAKIQKYGI